MKSLLLFLSTALFTVGAWAQQAVPQAAPPPSADVPADTVIATFGEGQKLTAGELKNFLAAMPTNMQQNALRDRKAFVQQFVMMHRLAEMAEQAKLDQNSPTKESLAFNRMYILMNAQLHEALGGINVKPGEAQSYYDENKSKFTQVKVKAIYIRYASGSADDTKGTKLPTEAEAEAKTLKLRAAIVEGADFVKMVKENSEDPTSAAKDGNFGTMHSTDNLPDAIRTAIFALKAGEVSAPVKQPNGFYLFRAEEVSAQPLAQVQEEVQNEVKQAHFKAWMDEVSRSLNLKIQNDAFFAEGGAGTASK
jgi:peptidyl-prolyl cis-trans isomerase C